MQNVAAALDNAAASADENDMISADSIAGLSDALYSSVTDSGRCGWFFRSTVFQ